MTTRDVYSYQEDSSCGTLPHLQVNLGVSAAVVWQLAPLVGRLRICLGHDMCG